MGQARSKVVFRRVVRDRNRSRVHRALRILRGQAAREATDPRYAARKQRERRQAKVRAKNQAMLRRFGRVASVLP